MLESFAKFIKKYLEDNNISFSSASRMCGMDRTVLSRYANGSRKPKNRESVIRIAEGLDMSSVYREKMLEYYDRENQSKEYSTSYSIVKEIIDKNYVMSGDDNWSSHNMCTFAEESSCILNSKEELLNAISYIVEDADSISMRFEPDYFWMDNEFQNIMTDIAKISSIKHIIGLCHSEWQYNHEKLMILKYILPLMLNNSDYQLFYNYQRKSSEGNDCSDMYYMITDKGMVLFDNGFKEGFFSNEHISMLYYSELFESIRLKCRVFAKSSDYGLLLSKENYECLEVSNNSTGMSICAPADCMDIWIVDKVTDAGACVKETGIVRLVREYIQNSSDNND